MKHIYQDILNAKNKGEKLLAVLLDPDKLELDTIAYSISKINKSKATHIFVGGSTVDNGKTETIVLAIKSFTQLPIILFPGDANQITNEANAILFLSLLSGRNPEFLIEQHVKSVPILTNTDLEIIPTGYILIDGGIETTVQKVSKTKPISRDNIDFVVNTAIAGQYLGKKLIYLEAGSGAKVSVGAKIIQAAANAINIPLIVGGGIRTKDQLDSIYNAGADIVVIGTAFENDPNFFE